MKKNDHFFQKIHMFVYMPKKLNENEISIISVLLNLPQKAFDPPTYIGCLDKIENEVDNLVLIHYNQEKIEDLLTREDIFSFQEIERIAACRGFIIDLNTKSIVCKSYGYTINVPINSIPNEPFFIKTFGVEILIEPNNAEYKIYYGGTLIRVWLYNGKRMLSTHKKINAENSHWGDSKTFLELFENNQNTFTLQNIPILENLVHIFLINDESLLIDTRYRIFNNKIVYLETFNLNDLSVERKKLETDQMINHIKHANNEVNPIQFPDVIDRETANNWLTTGSLTCKDKNIFSDSLWRGGEKVIVAYQGEIYTFMSESASWRKNIMDGRSNMYQIFCSLITPAFKKTEIKGCQKHLFPYAYSIEDLKEIQENLFLTGEFTDHEFVDDLLNYQSNNRYEIAITNLFFAAPIQRLPEIISIYETYQHDMFHAIDFLYDHKDELILLNNENRLDKFPSLHNKKTIIKSLKENIHFFEKENQIFTKRNIEISKSWPSLIQEKYNDYFHLFRNCPKNISNKQFIIKAQILFYIANMYGDILYAFINLPSKHAKTLEAWEKSKK